MLICGIVGLAPVARSRHLADVLRSVRVCSTRWMQMQPRAPRPSCIMPDRRLRIRGHTAGASARRERRPTLAMVRSGPSETSLQQSGHQYDAARPRRASEPVLQQSLAAAARVRPSFTSCHRRTAAPTDPRLESFLRQLGSQCPAVFVYVSTTGVYGDTGGAAVDEQSAAGPSHGPRATSCRCRKRRHGVVRGSRRALRDHACPRHLWAASPAAGAAAARRTCAAQRGLRAPATASTLTIS